MPRLSKTSKIKLDTCDERIQEIINTIIKFYDITVLCGYRGQEEQNRYYEEGKSKLKWPYSKHNGYPCRAVDIAPYPIDWNDYKRFYYMAGIVKGVAYTKGYNIRWGGDWDGDNDFKDQTFNDLVHFEVKE